MARLAMRGSAGQAKARLGMSWRGKARLAWHSTARRGKAGAAWQSSASRY
jgi:hypothetical protein